MANTKPFSLPAATDLTNVAFVVTQGTTAENAVTKKAPAALLDLGSKMSNPMTAEHDIVVGGVSGAPARVAIPAASLVGRVASGPIEGITPSDITEVDPSTEEFHPFGFNQSGAMRKSTGGRALRLVGVPGSSSDTGRLGDIAVDSSYIYMYNGSGWVRAAAGW